MLPGLLSRLVTIAPLKLSNFTEVFEDEQTIEKKKKKVQGAPDSTPNEISGSLHQSKESAKICCSQEKDLSL